MNNITIGQIATILAFIAALIGSIGVIEKVIVTWWRTAHKKSIDPVLEEIATMKDEIMAQMRENDDAINNKIDLLSSDIKALDVNQCKDVISTYIQALESGEKIDSVVEERAYEAMDRYTNVLHQNSYIHKRWEEVVINEGQKKE